MTDGLLNEILREVTKNWQHITLGDIVSVIQYLKKFGYLARTDSLTLTDIKEAIHKFQLLLGLMPDGLVGPKVLAGISLPRCGCPEHFTAEAREQLTKWGVNDLTYYIQSRDTDLSPELWDGIIGKAFQQISDVCNLRFKRTTTSNSANIIVSTGRGRGDNFDGSSGTLAWAELPRSTVYKGQLLCKFDLDELWTDAGRGIRLLNVATHEFGHIVGLTHSSVKTALLAPFYDPEVSKPQLNDDIIRLQGLYGKPEHEPQPAPKPTPVPQPTPNPVPSPTDGELTITIKGNIKDINIPGYRIYKS